MVVSFVVLIIIKRNKKGKNNLSLQRVRFMNGKPSFFTIYMKNTAMFLVEYKLSLNSGAFAKHK